MKVKKGLIAKTRKNAKNYGKTMVKARKVLGAVGAKETRAMTGAGYTAMKKTGLVKKGRLQVGARVRLMNEVSGVKGYSSKMRKSLKNK